MKIRLDQYLVQHGLTQSRERAKALIMSGIVFVNEQKVDKAGEMIKEDAKVEVRGHDIGYVSRGGLKLEKAMACFPITLEGDICMDIGSSTGGFTDCMLQNGAKKVYSVDVGHGQLAWKLRNDERVVNLERTNLRYVTSEQIPELMDLAVMDVSFISIKLVLPAVKALLKPGADLICLIKPQFEAGREEVGKKGVVRDRAVHEHVIHSILDFAPEIGLTVMGLDFSPIKGPEGNIEYICHMKNRVSEAVSINVEAVVTASHEAL